MRRLCTILAVVLIVFGIISMVSPIPGGVILLASGLTLLISVSPQARFCVQWLRARSPAFNKVISFLERKVGGRFESMGNTLKSTDPGNLKADLKHNEFVEAQIANEKTKQGGEK